MGPVVSVGNGGWWWRLTGLSIGGVPDVTVGGVAGHGEVAAQHATREHVTQTPHSAPSAPGQRARRLPFCTTTTASRATLRPWRQEMKPWAKMKLTKNRARYPFRTVGSDILQSRTTQICPTPLPAATHILPPPTTLFCCGSCLIPASFCFSCASPAADKIA